MSQPAITILVVTPQQASWDAVVNTNFQALRAWLEDGPLPVRDEAGALPAAGSWNQSIIFHEDSPGDWQLKMNPDGSAWERVAFAKTFVATLGQTTSDPPTMAEVQAIANKVDEVIEALRDGHAMPDS